MEKKFECRSCGKSFSAEEKGHVTCPHCGSDNVDYARIHIPYKYIGISTCVVLAILLLFKLNISSIFPSKNIEKIDEDTSVVIQNTDTINIEVINQEIEELGITIPPTIKGVDKIERNDDGKYNVVVKVEHAPEKGYAVVISDIKTNKEIAKSKDGSFNGIPFSSNDGKYYAQVVTSSGEALSEKTEITGFLEVKDISHKLSVRELQDLINKQDKSLLGHDNEYLSPVYQIKYAELPPGTESVPDNFGDVFENVKMGAWNSVEVISLDYDDSKHISTIMLRVNPNRPDF